MKAQDMEPVDDTPTPSGEETPAPTGSPGEAPPLLEAAESPAAEEEVCSRKVYQDLYDRHLRLQADFDNHRKRVERERREFQISATRHLISELLPVLDNLELAQRHAREGDAPLSFREGLDLVLRQVTGILERHGLLAIEAVGLPFDPNVHEAIAQLESDLHPEGTVLEEYQKGYLLGSRVLRPSRVSVSRRPLPAEDGPLGQDHRH
jgi:molecular chaperone GrpE